MADTIKSTFTGTIVIPLVRGDQSANRRITVQNPITDQASIGAAISSLSSWLRDTTDDNAKKRQWLFQPAGWGDFDIASSLQPDTLSPDFGAWSLSAEQPIIYETVEKTTKSYGENYGE